MLILTENDTLQVNLSGAVAANRLTLNASWRDIATDGSTFAPGPTKNLSNTDTTPLDFIGSPDSGKMRVIDFLSIYNSDTAPATVTIGPYDGSTLYPLCPLLLGIGERLEYSNDHGIRVFTASGAIKQSTTDSVALGTGEMQYVVLGSDVTNNNASANTIADVTGLSFAVTAGQTYWFEFVIPYTAAATTTGSRWAINGPASPTMLAYRSEYTLAATTTTLNSATAYDIPAGASASSLTTGNVATIWGIIKPSSNGTVIARFASEISSSAIVAKAGAVCRYMRVL